MKRKLRVKEFFFELKLNCSQEPFSNTTVVTNRWLLSAYYVSLYLRKYFRIFEIQTCIVGFSLNVGANLESISDFVSWELYYRSRCRKKQIKFFYASISILNEYLEGKISNKVVRYGWNCNLIQSLHKFKIMHDESSESGHKIVKKSMSERI